MWKGINGSNFWNPSYSKVLIYFLQHYVIMILILDIKFYGTSLVVICKKKYKKGNGYNCITKGKVMCGHNMEINKMTQMYFQYRHQILFKL